MQGNYDGDDRTTRVGFRDRVFSLLDRMGPLPYTLQDLARVVLPHVPPGRALADAEKETLARMAEVLLEECPVVLSTGEVVDNFERFLINGRSKRAWRCRLLLTLVEYAPLLAFRKPLKRLSKEERSRYVDEKLRRGGFPWAICAKVRYLAYAGAYGHESANLATGFVPFADRPRARDNAAAVAGAA